MPVLTVFAGPNGSGKSTVSRFWNLGPDVVILDPDAIARQRRPANPRAAAIDAGREVLRSTERYIREGADFAIETTLSGAWTATAIRKAKLKGFFVRLIYVCLKSAELNVQRVCERVARGGHHVPIEDIRRRYLRSLSNLRQIARIVNEAMLYDNSEERPKLVAEVEAGKVKSHATNLPDWAKNLCDDLI